MGARMSGLSLLGKKIWGLALWMGVAVAACSDQSIPDETEQTARAAQALTTDQSRVLGFESVGLGSNDWSATSGVLSSSERRVEGSRALGIANGGNSEIVSARLSSLGAVVNKITLDLLLPAGQPNPHWMGTLKLETSRQAATFHSNQMPASTERALKARSCCHET